ncbi:uncharacterized protein LOC143300198 isoform X2 [Babylonia areolata]
MKAASVAVSSGPALCAWPASTAMESSDQLPVYKQKMEQMATLIRHYQCELESQKVRRDGVETVSRLLAESRQENVFLKKQHAATQMVVKNLQNKLAMSGVVSNAEADDNEMIVPGTSKQTLTNLALENKRLRSLLQQENSSESSDSLQKTAEDKETKQHSVDQLEAENHSMKRKLSELEGLFRSSNSEKDRQLLHYQEEIQQLRKQSRETNANKAGTGVSVLKEQLKAFMAECANFESHLESVQQTEEEDEKKGPAIELEPVTEQAVQGTDTVDGLEVQQLLEEKQKLQSRVGEVMEMNQRWQEFFNERDRYTKALEQKVQDLEARLQETLHKASTPEISHRTEQILEQSRRDVGQAESLRKKAEGEVERLRQEVVFRDTQLSQLQSQVAILKQAAQHQQMSSEARSVIDHLKAQIQVCTEDFEKERQDRQAALQKVSGLQEQNSRLQKLITHLQTLLAQTERSSAQEQSCHEAFSNFHHSRPPFRQSVLTYDSASAPNSDDDSRDYPDFEQERANRRQLQDAPGPVSLPAFTMELLSRGSQKPRLSLSDPALSSESGGKKENYLTCPKCNKEFSEEQQGELLAHMDVCWE